MRLADFPRLRIGSTPTPLEPMPRLSAALGGPSLYVKRDDRSGGAFGGNKIRKLEFLVADALACGADTLVTQGSMQSHHARETAAIAARLGLGCELLLGDRTGIASSEYRQSGSALANELFGANVHAWDGATTLDAATAALAAQLRSRGRTPYVLPNGGSNALGALGYVACALELLGQLEALGVAASRIVHASGSGATQAGLVVGLAAAGAAIAVLGISVGAPRDVQEDKVHALAARTAELLGLAEPIARDSVRADGDHVGAGYGIATDAMVDAVALTARTEGILLDPVYSGKAMAALVDLVGRGAFADGETIVFLHTGGAIGLNAYAAPIRERLARRPSGGGREIPARPAPR